MPASSDQHDMSNVNEQPTAPQNEPQQRFAEMYRTQYTPWDTGIVPPEVQDAVAGASPIAPGRALDCGCGTGTTSLFLARHGWQVTGIDFVVQAIELAQAKAAAQREEIERAGGSVRFLVADITRLNAPDTPDEQASLLVDIGCLTGIPFDRRAAYAQVVARHAAPGALYMLYARFPQEDGSGPPGCTPEEVDALFAETFMLERRELGSDPRGGASMWNWLRRRPGKM